jgi:antitoxin HicB
MSNQHIGSNFDEFLRQEGIFEEVEAGAIKKVVACMIEQAMAESHITKTEMARRMETSRTQLDRLLDPSYPSVTLATIAKAATALGKKISISFEDFLPVKNDVIAS